MLTELVTNAVEHGLRGKADGHVIIESRRSPESLTISVTDNGGGLEENEVGDGLGTQIVRTLVDGELGGAIIWGSTSAGTRVEIQIPLRFVEERVAHRGVPLT